MVGENGKSLLLELYFAVCKANRVLLDQCCENGDSAGLRIKCLPIPRGLGGGVVWAKIPFLDPSFLILACENILL